MRGYFLKRVTLLLTLTIQILFYYPGASYSARITDIRFWSAPDHTRVVLDLTKPVQYETPKQENPSQYILELKGIKSFPSKIEFVVDDRYLSRIRLIDLGKEKLRLILYQKKSLISNIFTLKPYLDKPHRLVIDLVDPRQEKIEQEDRQKQKGIYPKGTKIVVIDPGHGGEDPGAVGPKGTMEKDIVLKVGERVVNLLQRENGIKAFLTRRGDYFIPLEGRVRIARDYNADLFISIHTDGSFNRQARGSSVYCLSISGATDQAAKLLADKENMSNILGGASLRPASITRDPNLNQILLDLMQNNSMKESFRFAEFALDEIKKVNQLKYLSYRQANFIVLRAPDIPSVLIEMSYITNKDDERLLNRIEFQEKMARAIEKAIIRYFKRHN